MKKSNLKLPRILLCLLSISLFPYPFARSQEAIPSVSPQRKPSGIDYTAAIHYTLAVRAPDAASHSANRIAQFHITVTAPRSNPSFVEFAIPAWTPGYYQILHYEKGIQNALAHDASGRALPVSHPSERVWRVDTSGLPVSARLSDAPAVTLSYDVDANEEGLGFFGSSLDLRNQRGYINGAAALMYPVGQTQSPCVLALDAPAGWQIATPMEPAIAQTATAATQTEKEAAPAAAKRFQATTYDELIDCPVQLGKFDTVDFQESGVKFQCVLVGRQAGSKTAMSDSLRRITRATIALFGSAPFTHYQFFYHIGESGFYGGLEHHNSTVIHLALGAGNGTNEDFLTTSAHELFHAWNVKHLRPAGLGPFDYAQAVHTNSLWFAEGVTDYYAQLLLVRSGLKNQDWFWRDMAQRIQLLDHTPSRIRVPLITASSRAWEGGSEGYDGLSYYLKGSLVGLYFDLRIRAATHNQASLDDVMRRLDTAYGARDIAYPEDAILTAINAVVHQNLQPEYARLVESSKEIDWNPALAPAGLQLQRDPTPFLGIRLAEAQGSNQPGALIQTVETGHAAARMGLLAGDRILRIALNTGGRSDARTVNVDNFHDVVHSLPRHASLLLEVQRDSQILQLSGVVGEVFDHHQLMPFPTGTLTPQEQQNAKTLQQRMFAPTPLFSTTRSAVAEPSTP